MTAAGDSAPAGAPHTMQCMEVWGGFGASDNGVVMPGLDVWVLSRPYQASAEGGDVHYVSSCGTGRISRLLVADVSGHGTSVASIARDLRDLMRRYVNYVDQAAFVQRLNGSFVELTKSGLFATAVVATFFAPSATLTLTNAGHPRPLLYSAAGRRWRLAPEVGAGSGPGFANLPLGMFEETGYASVALQASTGDIAVVYSDSLIEAPLPTAQGGRPGRLLGLEGLLEVAGSIPAEPAETLASRLYQAVLSRCAPGTSTLGDDVTVLVMRVNGQGGPAPLGARLRAAWRFAGMVVRSVAGGAPAPWPELSGVNIIGAFARRVSRGYGRGADRI